MNIYDLLDHYPECADKQVTVQGILMENARQPFVGMTTKDWANGRCVHLRHPDIFEILFNQIFPHTLAGGDTMFLYPVTVLGRLSRFDESGPYVLDMIQLIELVLDDKKIDLQLNPV